MAPYIPYRETIKGSAETESKYKKQSGGHGQYGHVKIQVDPLYDGSEFAFVDKNFLVVLYLNNTYQQWKRVPKKP